MNNLYKEGYIIVHDGYTYVCRIVGEKEAYFNKYVFKGLFKNPTKMYGVGGCGGFQEDESGYSFKCDDHVILWSEIYDTNRCGTNKKDFRPTAVPKHPIIGREDGCSVLWNLNVLKGCYPVEYEKYLEYLVENLENKK